MTRCSGVAPDGTQCALEKGHVDANGELIPGPCITEAEAASRYGPPVMRAPPGPCKGVNANGQPCTLLAGHGDRCLF